MDQGTEEKNQEDRELQQQARETGDHAFVTIAEKDIQNTLNPPMVSDRQRQASEVIRKSRSEK